MVNRNVILVLFILAMTLIAIGASTLFVVPVVKVNVTFVEKEGIVQATNYSIVQGSVGGFNKPNKDVANSLPAIFGRVTLGTGKDASIGPWETLPYKGNGTYQLNLGFYNGRIPKVGMPIHISVLVADKDGERIGYLVKDMEWK